MSIAEKGKKVLSFVFLTSTINRRNTTSIGLVILFMIVYAMSGGKIFMAPKVTTGEGFGSVQQGTTSGSLQFSGDVIDDNGAGAAKRKDKALFGDTDVQAPSGKSAFQPDTNNAPGSGTDSLTELQQRLEKLNVDKRPKRQN